MRSLYIIVTAVLAGTATVANAQLPTAPKVNVSSITNGLKVLESLTPPTVPSWMDVKQCTVRRYFKSDESVLDDIPEGEGCVINNPDFFEIYADNSPNVTDRSSLTTIPFKDQSRWVVEVRKPRLVDPIVSIVTNFNKQPLYYCHSNPSDDLIAKGLTSLKSVFGRKTVLDEKFLKRIDGGAMDFILFVRNPPHFADPDSISSFLEQSKAQLGDLQQKVVFNFYRNADYTDMFSIFETDIVRTKTGFSTHLAVPAGARSLVMMFQTNSPFYSVGQLTMSMYQARLLYEDTFKSILNASVLLGFSFVLIVPITFVVEDIIKRRVPLIQSVDLLRHQGPRLVRSFMFTMMMAVLYIFFQWLKQSGGGAKGTDTSGTSSSADGEIIGNKQLDVLPFFSGIDADTFAATPLLKTLKTIIFITFFLAVGVMFWPLFVCFGHAASRSSRTAGILGVIVGLNLLLFRTTLEYLTSPPNRALWRKIMIELPEILVYISVVAYFILNSASPEYFQNRYRKSYFKDVNYVRALLRTVKLNTNAAVMAMEPPKPKNGFLAFFQKVDNRPIWLRGRKELTMIQKTKLFWSNFRMPPRMMAAIFMMILFTYFNLAGIVQSIIDRDAVISCNVGMFGEQIIAGVAMVSKFVGAFTAMGSYGATLSGTLQDMTSNIIDEAGPNVLNEFTKIIMGSAYSAGVLVILILLFNIYDFATSFQNDVEKLRKGDYSRTSGFKVSTGQGMSFLGTQIGFAFVGSLYLMFICQILCFLLAVFFRYRFVRELAWKFLTQNGLIIVSFVVSYAIFYLQMYLGGTLFVAKLEEEDPNAAQAIAEGRKPKPIYISTNFWISNITMYSHLDYVFLFPNLITGILAFLSNLIKLIIGSAFYAYRLDKNSEYGFKFMTPKSIVYFSWLVQEHHHSNPVIHVFIKMLRDWKNVNAAGILEQSFGATGRGGYKQYAQQGSVALSGEKALRRRRIKNKWLLCYTLVNNPSITKYRKHVVKETFLKEFIAFNEGPIMRQQELQRIKEALERMGDVKAEMRKREIDLFESMKKEGFGRSLDGAESPLPTYDANLQAASTQMETVSTMQTYNNYQPNQGSSVGRSFGLTSSQSQQQQQQPTYVSPSPVSYNSPTPSTSSTSTAYAPRSTSQGYNGPATPLHSPNQYQPRPNQYSPPQSPSYGSTAPAPNHYDQPGSPAAIAAARVAASSTGGYNSSSFNSNDGHRQQQSLPQSSSGYSYGGQGQQAQQPSAPPRGASRY
ncbi:hypothetical protein HDU97_000928 [Phlyctochytrium planicorne]|nr:hypothetical protein HDU97_000928 [Phlyctochytrium planicorne]